MERNAHTPADRSPDSPDSPDARPVHLAVFKRLPGMRAACGATLAGLADLTEDASRVTCADCLSRLVVEVPSEETLRARAVLRPHPGQPFRWEVEAADPHYLLAHVLLDVLHGRDPYYRASVARLDGDKAEERRVQWAAGFLQEARAIASDCGRWEIQDLGPYLRLSTARETLKGASVHYLRSALLDALEEQGRIRRNVDASGPIGEEARRIQAADAESLEDPDPDADAPDLGPNHATDCNGEDWEYSGQGYNRVRVCACGAEDHAPEDALPPTEAERATERAERYGLDAAEVLEGFARVAFADAWGNAVERAGEVYAPELGELNRSGWERPNLSGVELTDAAPRTRGTFYADARPIVRAVLLGVPEETLRAWADFGDATRIGGSLYLDAAGHGAGLGDYDLPRVPRDLEVNGLPYSGGRPASFGNLDARGFPDLEWTEIPDACGDYALPDWTDLYAADACASPDGKRSAEGAAKAVAGLLRAWKAGTLDAEDVLAHADRILGGYGVERLDLPAPEDSESGGVARYVNMGDTYAGTLIYLEDADAPRGRFLASDWGSVLEAAEAERTECTGETRCPHCGEWGMGGLDAGNLDYLDPRETGEECRECGNVAS